VTHRSDEDVIRPFALRPTVAEVDLGAIRSNCTGIRRRVGPRVRILAAVKANAYGHGAVPVAKALLNAGADGFGVAFPEEAIELRNAGITSQILVFTLPAPGRVKPYLDHGLESTVATVDDLRLLTDAAVAAGRTASIHIKVDTGMNRIGVQRAKLVSFLRALAKMPRLEVKGVCTHFAHSEIRDKRFTHLQLERFDEAVAMLRRHGVEPPDVHCANSAAILDLPDSFFTMVRPGIMLYGYYPSDETTESVRLKPALTLRSTVSMVKEIERGESVSYGRRYIARRRTRIATVPLGYADGYSRQLTGKASVLIRGAAHPVAGTICMDQFMVDVGQSPVRSGDDVVLIGAQRGREISAWDIARKLNTIPYEVCCAISARVPRTYKGL
jgi:alanine racemase